MKVNLKSSLLQSSIKSALFDNIHCRQCWTKCTIDYVQGQSPEPKIREYFYFIDHQGMLFLDDSRMKNFTSCFKEKKFIHFFFSRLKRNESKRFEKEFPWISLCGRERNYVRCDDLPCVFTHMTTVDSEPHLSFGHAGDLLTFPFDPHSICMFENGRVYHPAADRYGSVGLIKSSFAIEMSNSFSYGANESIPSHFSWAGKKYELNNKLLSVLNSAADKV